MVTAEGVYARMVAVSPLTPPILTADVLELVKVYAPLLLLTPDIMEVNENAASPNVFVTWETD
jgi:hypothetical protein